MTNFYSEQFMINGKKILKTAYVAGSGSNYQLLTGTPSDQLQFKLIDISQYQIMNISMGGMFSLAVNQNQHLLVWGLLGEAIIKVPKSLMCNNVVNISCGWDHALILTSDNLLFGIGRNKQKQLKEDGNVYYQNLVEVNNPLQIQFLLCGFRQSYITNKTTILGRGENRNKELGSNQKKGEWIQVGTIVHGIKKIECGKRFLVVLDDQRNVHGCGNNQYKVMKNKPDVVLELELVYEQVDDVSAGWNHIVIVSNGRIMTFGRNNFGQLGREQNQKDFLVKIQQREQFSNVDNLTSGSQFNFVKIEQDVYGWGWNQHSNISSKKEQIIRYPEKIEVPFEVDRIVTNGACTIFLN